MIIQYVYYDTWFLWNPAAILVSLAISSVAYLVLSSTHTDGTLKVRVARPRWIASIPSVASIVWLGLYCVIPIVAYLMVSYWLDRVKAKEAYK